MKNIFFTVALIAVLLVGCEKKPQDTRISELKLLPVSTENPSGEPFLFTAPDDKVYLSWIEQKEDTSYLMFSTFTGDTWSKPRLITSGTNWFVNWADYPTIAADAHGHLMAHFLPKSGAGTYAYDVKLIQSSDNGTSWETPYILHDDGKQVEHGFASILPYNDNFFITWLDGRNTGNIDKHHEPSDHDGGHEGAMSVRAAVIGLTGNKISEWSLDQRVCDCCQTTTALTDNGPVVIYRDRSEHEVRDMSIVRLIDSTWTKPQVIHEDNWKIAGCPVNGPRADAIGNDLVIAWFSAPEGDTQVKLTFSGDGGASFDPPIRIDSAKSIGRVDVVMLDEDTAVVTYMEGADIKAIKVSRDGTKSKPIFVSSSSEARASGFPQMTKSGNQLIFAWTDSEENKIKTALLNDL